MLMNAAVGSAKNIIPNREKAASNEPVSNGNSWASAWTNRTRSFPFAARRANVSTAADISIPTTVPSGATALARSSAVSPPPQPMSRMLSPGWGASAVRAQRPSGASCSSKGSRTSAHAPTRSSSWVSAGRGSFWSMLRSLLDGLGMSRWPGKLLLSVLNVGCWGPAPTIVGTFCAHSGPKPGRCNQQKPRRSCVGGTLGGVHLGRL